MSLPDAKVVLPDLRCLGPIRMLVLLGASRFRIDAERKKSVECRMERRNLRNLADEIPVKRFEMTEIENQPVALGNRSLVQRLRLNQAE